MPDEIVNTHLLCGIPIDIFVNRGIIVGEITTYKDQGATMDYEMIHTCLRVADIDASEKFYTEAFGFVISRKKDFPEHKFTLSYLTAPGGGFELELTYNYDHGPYEMGDGYSHLAVGVADLEGSHQQHEEMGLNPKPLRGLPDSPPKYYFLEDPDGYLVEVVRTD